MLELVQLREEGVDDLHTRAVVSDDAERRDEDAERTRKASEGSLPDMAPALAAVRDSTSSAPRFQRPRSAPPQPAKKRKDLPISTTTNPLSSSTISVTCANNRWTSLPDSENHLEKSECELISMSLPCW